MTQQITFHYEGRFGLCPVLIDSITSPTPTLYPKYDNTDWLITLSEWYYAVKFTIAETLNPDYDCAWPIKVNRRLSTPVVREV